MLFVCFLAEAASVLDDGGMINILHSGMMAGDIFLADGPFSLGWWDDDDNFDCCGHTCPKRLR